MEKYTKLSYDLAERTTKAYSTSFSMSSRLFDSSIRKHIYAVYGLVRIADEIVDTYMGADSEDILNQLESHVLELLQHEQPYSPNPIVQAFVTTAQEFSIDTSLITPFFKSMRTDITDTSFTQDSYQAYIYGSAEVIGLMCLKIFTNNDKKLYEKLKPGACALGSAYQKVNFLRDMKSDQEERGRVYFPGITYDTFNDAEKKLIERDIEKDFLVARSFIASLPLSARKAIQTSYDYYWQLLLMIKRSTAHDITSRRLRVPNAMKLIIFAKAKVTPQ